MVVRQRSISYSAVQVPPAEKSLKDPLKETLKEISMVGNGTDETVVPWKNTFNMRPLTLAALTLSKPQSRSPQTPLSRMRCRNIVSAAKSLDILRQNLQSAINKEIDIVIKKYLEKFFEPAVTNIRKNLGTNSVSEDLLREVCRTMLEEAKQMYCAGFTSALNRGTSPFTEFEIPIKPSEQVLLAKKRKRTELDNGTKKKHVYPLITKWDPSRVNKETQFILSTIAGKCLGLGSLRGRLCTKHPDVVRYGVDQDDREWLSTARVPGLNSSIPSIYLMFLEDIVELASSDEYRNSTNLILSELKGFEVPDFIQRKIRAYMTLMRAKHIANQNNSTNNDEEQTSIGVGVDYVSSTMTPPQTLLDSAGVKGSRSSGGGGGGGSSGVGDGGLSSGGGERCQGSRDHILHIPINLPLVGCEIQWGDELVELESPYLSLVSTEEED